MPKLGDTPTPADSEAIDEGWEDVAPKSSDQPDASAKPPGAEKTTDAAKPDDTAKPDDANADKRYSNKTTPPVRPTMPTVEEDDPLVYDVDEGRPTLPMVDPLAFDKAEPDD